jgi:hypothetical protein
MAVPRRIPPFPPPNPEHVAATKARAAERRERYEAERPTRLAMLDLGPELRDVDAAADCWCACHPRPADQGLHDGGARCPCQGTVEDRAEALANLREILPYPTPEEDARRDAEVAAFDAAAEALGVEVKQWGGMAPFQISGVVAGRAFYLRCRHGAWALTIADDNDPLGDPVPGLGVTIRVAEGDEDDLFDDGSGRPGPVVALHTAVRAITDFLTRRTCLHVSPGAMIAFCPYCGVRLAEADRWRSV